jgi:tungstate transport system substrate-binding protein
MRSIFKISPLARKLRCAALGMALASLTANAMAQSIVMSSTTSTEQSGLFGYLLPEFKKASGIDIKVVALGTGQALDMARRGDADVVFVHDQVAEEKFVADGFGLKRLAVMYNDFVVVGPQADPASVKGNDIVAALKKIWQAMPHLCLEGTRVARMLPN